jgi:RING-type zinc-finger
LIAEFFLDHTIIMTAAGLRDMQTQLSNITECPICAGTYSDPRSLPCVHTYCLECIKGFSKDKLPGDCVACPVCRTEFSIPAKGVDSLPKNFFVEQLKDMTKMMKVEEDKLLSSVPSVSRNSVKIAFALTKE